MSQQIHKPRGDNEDSSKDAHGNYFMRVPIILMRTDMGSALPYVSVNYSNSKTYNFPDEESQTKESLKNLSSGNYEDFTIEEYLKHIDS